MFQKQRTLKHKLLRWKWPFAVSFLLIAILWRILTPHTPLPIAEENISAVPFHHFEDNTMVINNEVNLPDLNEILPEPLQSESAAAKKILESNIIEAIMAQNSKQFTVQRGDSLAGYFQQLKIPASELHYLLKTITHSKLLQKLQPGQILSFELTPDNAITQLNVSIDKLTNLTIKKQAHQKYISQLVKKDVERKTAFGSGKIYDSLYLAGKQAKLSDKLIMSLAQIFEYDIDFALDIRPGDSFRVLFEEHYIDNEKIDTGAILAAEFTNQGKTYQAFQYIDANGKSAYFKADGQSLTKAFIRTPVAYTRISSHFNLSRKHPVLHKIRAHKGVDYAAPHGTPVKASGNGKVIHAGRKGGYGNAVILQHGSKYSTLYAHLSKIGKGVRPGREVKQGQVIGYVGSTGLASGPHLHYEFRVNGVHQNPLTVALPNSNGIPNSKISDYQTQTQLYLDQMASHEQMLVATHKEAHLDYTR